MLTPPRAVGAAVALALALTLVGGCKKDEAPAAPGAAVAKSAAAAPASARPEAPPRAPGVMPVDFPSASITANAGDYALVPSKRWIDDAFVKGGDKPAFTYYGAKIVGAGPLDTKLQMQTGEPLTAPNGLVVPIKPGQRANAGDVVLTWWQSGSGMQRAIVVGGGPAEPRVLYLDMGWENPSGAAKKEDTLRPNSFAVLSGALEPGVSVACKDGAAQRHGIVTGVSADKLLVVGWAGATRALPRAGCTVVPPAVGLAAGREVAVPYLGAYTKGTVDKVDARMGRVTVKFTGGGKERSEAFGVQNVAVGLAGL